jgi:hypothetical protein
MMDVILDSTKMGDIRYTVFSAAKEGKVFKLNVSIDQRERENGPFPCFATFVNKGTFITALVIDNLII